LKKILWLPGVLLCAAVSICGAGAVKLSENGAIRFLDELDSLSMQGKAEEYCARLHDDLAVSIRDHTAPGLPREFDGGKAQFCEYISMAAKGMDLLGPQTSVTRHDFEVSRSWLHPWTVQVSYHETRITRMTRVRVTLNTVSDDRWILVNSVEGVKVLRLDSESRLAE
jgi:hypothetical protein